MLNPAIIPLNLQILLNKLEKGGVGWGGVSFFLGCSREEGMGEGYLTLHVNKGVVD